MLLQCYYGTLSVLLNSCLTAIGRKDVGTYYPTSSLADRYIGRLAHYLTSWPAFIINNAVTPVCIGLAYEDTDHLPFMHSPMGHMYPCEVWRLLGTIA